MTKKNFTGILILYIAIVAIGFMVDAATKSSIPPVVAAAHEATNHSHPILLGLLCVMIIVATLAGIIGLFFFWKPSVYIFLGSVAAKILVSIAIPWSVTSGWYTVFYEWQLVMDGIILTLALTGPAKPLFEKK